MINAEQAPVASAEQLSPEQRLVSFFAKSDAKPERAESESEPSETPEQSATETQETDEQPEQTETEQAQASETEDGLVEFEFEGEVIRAKPALRDAVLRRADYTRKTQEVAELHRQAAQVAEQQRMQAEFQQATLAEHNQLQTIESQIEAYKSLDWTGMDSETLIRNRHSLDMLREAAQDLRSKLGEKQNEFVERQQKQFADQAKAAYEYISKKVPTFTPNSETEKQVAKYVEENGMPQEAFVRGAVTFPALAVLAHKAMQFDQLQAKKATTVQAVKKAAPVLKPSAQTQTANQQQYQKVRERLKKTGSLDDAVAAIKRLI